MLKPATLILHNNKTHAVKRFHPWVFSGAVKKRIGNPDQGDIVEIVSEAGEWLGMGHFGTGSVSARIFSFTKPDSLESLWQSKFEQAFSVRKAGGLAESEHTNAYRLINGEGDGMPGLIVDWYNGTAVIQAHSKGMHRERDKFAQVLQQLYGGKLVAVYDKSTATLHHKPDADEHSGAGENKDSYLFGTPSDIIAKENDHLFKIDVQQGQKTGFFIDQRDNRQLLGKYSGGKNVLNTFCYSGGFSIYALKAGATLVHSVDSSEKAIDLTNQNVKLNGLENTNHQAYARDVFEFLKDAGNYDIVILDPPAFAKGQSARHAAIKAYTRLNAAAFKRIKAGGIIFTFSCSQVVDREMFYGAVTAAAIESGRTIRVLHHLTQPADHPISIYNPEGVYLKGLVLHVE